MNNHLKGRIALVTGSSRGIGRAIAIALGQAGADVAVNCRAHEEEALEVSRGIRAFGRRSITVCVDISVESGLCSLTEAVVGELGPVDILVNNAGMAVQKKLEEISKRDWDESIAVNLTSAFLLTQALLPGMRSRRWGRIISIASVAAQIGGIVGPHYAASKAGLIGLMHYFASHFASEGITANTIAPGPVLTDMSAGLPELDESMVPVNRLGTPEEVGSVAVLIASNGYITGQTINVNGGRYMS